MPSVATALLVMRGLAAEPRFPIPLLPSLQLRSRPIAVSGDVRLFRDFLSSRICSQNRTIFGTSFMASRFSETQSLAFDASSFRFFVSSMRRESLSTNSSGLLKRSAVSPSMISSL